jgi:hypothetical protein
MYVLLASHYCQLYGALQRLLGCTTAASCDSYRQIRHICTLLIVEWKLFYLLLPVILWLSDQMCLNFIKVHQINPVFRIQRIQIQGIPDNNIPWRFEPHFLRPVWCRKRIELAPSVRPFPLIFISDSSQSTYLTWCTSISDIILSWESLMY